MSDLYTATQAREKLGGIAAANLQRLVAAGKIRKVVPPNNKRKGLYCKKDVDALAQAMQEFAVTHSLIPRSTMSELVQMQNGISTGKD